MITGAELEYYFNNAYSYFLQLLDNWAFRLLLIVAILAVTSLVARSFNYFIKHYFRRSSTHLNIDQTRFSIASKLITALIYTVGIGFAASVIPSLRTISLSLITGAGVLAAIVGFASQQAFSNLISGIFIAIFKPFRVGDRVKVGNYDGVVEDITLRDTIIRDFENKRIIIPNSIVGNESIINYSIEDPRICKFIEFEISYDSNIDKAMKIMREEAEKHRLCIDVRTEEEKKKKQPKVQVRVLSLKDSGVLLRAWVWAANPSDAFVLKTELNKSIKERFDREGIEIPYPYRTVVLKQNKKKPAKRSAKRK
ncbi:mechanosensitive ion channel family protein [Candidatus Woesearchaeota archaeon]|nr:MAG: mechanosensitive ion channel family protein [Candidatus Woesearchaeota archaeon]